MKAVTVQSSFSMGKPTPTVRRVQTLPDSLIQKAHNILCKFVLIGWGIYPLGYMIGTSGWYDFVDALPLNMDVVYNIGDAINKIGFGLVIYSLAVSDK